MSNSNEHTHRSTYTVEEVARILGISRTTAYECVRRGDIQARRFGRRVVVPTIVVDRLLHATDDLRSDDAMPGEKSEHALLRTVSQNATHDVSRRTVGLLDEVRSYIVRLRCPRWLTRIRHRCC